MITEYISTKTARKILGVTTQTLRNWDAEGKINTIRSASGLRLYSSNDINHLCDTLNLEPKKKIAYCRVSSKKQIDDLERQKNFFQTSYPEYEIIDDIGSGINWKRKGLLKMLEYVINDQISEIIIAHKDRLCRFAFEIIEWLLIKHDVKLIILDKDEHKSPDFELAEDVLSIIHVYSCKQMGKRRYKTKKDKSNENCSNDE